MVCICEIRDFFGCKEAWSDKEKRITTLHTWTVLGHFQRQISRSSSSVSQRIFGNGIRCREVAKQNWEKRSINTVTYNQAFGSVRYHLGVQNSLWRPQQRQEIAGFANFRWCRRDYVLCCRWCSMDMRAAAILFERYRPFCRPLFPHQSHLIPK